MLWWAQVKALIPSFFTHWVLLVCLAACAWYAFTRIYTQFVFHWKTPVLAGSVMGAFFAINTTMNIYQNHTIVNFNNRHQMQLGQTQPQAPNQAPVDPALQMKADFLKTVEMFLSDPKQITAENKQKLFSSYGKLFPRGKEDKDMFFREISNVYRCQRQFWEDALVSFKAKQAIKSEARKECEGLGGEFYNRPKLIPADVIAKNDEMVSQLAARKRIPASDGKDLDEKLIQDFVKQQASNLELVKKIFE